MSACPTCGTPITATCKDCGQPLARWQARTDQIQWIHAGVGAWVTCPSKGEPKPVAA